MANVDQEILSREALDNGLFDPTRALPMWTVMGVSLTSGQVLAKDRLIHAGFDLADNTPGCSATIWRSLAPDASLLVLRGSVHLHDDRHMLETTAPESFQHTWNWVIAKDSEYDDQSMALLMEVSEAGDFHHAMLDVHSLIYMNSVNRHMVTMPLVDGKIQTVILQLQGYGPDQLDEVQKRLCQLLDENPDLKSAHLWPEKAAE